MARHMNWLDVTALILVAIGALNWGLIGFFEFDLVSAILGEMSFLSRTVYALVGLAGLYTIWTLVKVGQDAGSGRMTPRTS